MKSFKDHFNEAKDTVKKDKSGKVVSWKHEGDWHPAEAHKDEFGNPIKKVAKHLAKKGQKGPVVPVAEDWGTSDTTAAMRVMWNTINSEFAGKLSIESMTAAAERAAEMYQESIGLDFKEATDAFLGYFMRRPDGVAAERNQKNEAIDDVVEQMDGSQTYFKLTSSRAKNIAQEMRDVGQLPSISFHGDVASANYVDVAALRSKLIQNGQIDAFEVVVDESMPVPASQDELDEAGGKPPAATMKKPVKKPVAEIPANMSDPTERGPGVHGGASNKKQYSITDYEEIEGPNPGGFSAANWISGATHGYAEGYAAGYAAANPQKKKDRNSGIMPRDSAAIKQLIRQGR